MLRRRFLASVAALVVAPFVKPRVEPTWYFINKKYLRFGGKPVVFDDWRHASQTITLDPANLSTAERSLVAAIHQKFGLTTLKDA
jgi:hypothetical protein